MKTNQAFIIYNDFVILDMIFIVKSVILYWNIC